MIFGSFVDMLDELFSRISMEFKYQQFLIDQFILLSSCDGSKAFSVSMLNMISFNRINWLDSVHQQYPKQFYQQPKFVNLAEHGNSSQTKI